MAAAATFGTVYSLRVSCRLGASRATVYRALIDPAAIVRWRFPDGMSAQLHEFDAREGGAFRISLSYDRPGAAGKTAGNTDTYRGHFVRLVPGEQVVEELAFETADPALGAPMTMTTTLSDTDDGGTLVVIAHDGIPDAIPTADNETGTRMALDRLRALVEAGTPGAPATSGIR
ncbi:SRPBCC domain-containing protein [Parafrankia sp. EUN1f]|uniref:SRPBCC domain-containing protein n=1 Tax=Parafrankia sp. EUN1f TaxID=102897 RepID=UPI0001C45DFC|nr:SRPBCC domain-containing protein [Parafrankia sp. EUN1f]EFC84307.1 Activator of Hsp90 ATPase 1 family protein [Parafrankia sp. EUN1f]